MKVAVTGCTGFIGHRLCRELLKQGHEVSAWVRNVERARASVPYPIQFFRWDGLSNDISMGSLQGVDAVIHLAGENIFQGRWTPERKKKIIASRVDSTTQLVNVIKRDGAKPQVFICASAVGIYGPRGDETIDEGSGLGFDFLAGLCCDWEKASTAVDELGIRRVNLRTGVVLGQEGGILQRLIPVFESFAGGPLGTGKQWMSWIHQEDAVRAIIFALEHPEVRGPVNVTAPEPETNEAFSKKIGAALRRPSFLKAPAFALQAALGEMASVALTGQRVLPKKLLNQGFEFRFPELSSALQDIFGKDYEPGEREFRTEQWVSKKREEVFAYFSEAKNLEALTPSFLSFEMLRQSTSKVEKGTELEYRLKIHGVPVRWKTLITDCRPSEGFTDIQLKGPYKKWHHDHRFESMKGGTLITDRVRYRVPLGSLGALAAGRFVSRDLQRIFAFRKKVIGETFR